MPAACAVEVGAGEDEPAGHDPVVEHLPGAVDVGEEASSARTRCLTPRVERVPLGGVDDPRDRSSGKGRSSPPYAKVTPRSVKTRASWSARERRSVTESGCSVREQGAVGRTRLARPPNISSQASAIEY